MAPRPSLSTALRRQWRMALLLQKQPWSVAELAEKFSVSKATAQRDLDLLGELFVVKVIRDPLHDQRAFYGMPKGFRPRR